MTRLNELWVEVESALAEHTVSGYKIAIIEAYKVLDAVLKSKGYPGKTIEKKLFWAGYSLKDKKGITEGLKLHNEIIKKFSFKLTDFEAKDIVGEYKKAIAEIQEEPAFSMMDKIKVFAENYLSPKSVLFWRNLASVFGFFLAVKLLSGTEVGGRMVQKVVDVSGFAISWQFLAIIIVLIIIALVVHSYFSNKSPVKIKDDNITDKDHGLHH